MINKAKNFQDTKAGNHGYCRLYLFVGILLALCDKV